MSGQPRPATHDPRPCRPQGGKRPGAGAPRGNMNALKSGRYSKRLRALRAALAAMPITADVLAKTTARDRRKMEMLAYGLQSYAEMLLLIASGRSIDGLADPQLRQRALYAIPIKQSAPAAGVRRGGRRVGKPGCVGDQALASRSGALT